MKKVILDFNVPENKEQVQAYLADKLALSEHYSGSLDALYDELTSLLEPTAVGFYLPTPEADDLDFELMMYLDQIKKVFKDAEEDSTNLAVIFGDIADDFDEDEDSEAFSEVY